MMLAFFRTFLAVIAAIMFLICVPTVLLLAMALLADDGPRDDSWLTVRLDGTLLEYYGPTTIHDLVDHPPTCLMEITENLEKAAVDDRIRGVLFRLESFSAGAGKLDEIRTGIRAVREAGKPVYAYAFDLTDTGLYLASECDSTFLFPDGMVYVLGRGVVMEHFKGTLDLLDISVNIHAIDEYKSAHEMFSREHSSPEALDNIRWMVEDLATAWDTAVTENRGFAEGDLDEFRKRAIFRADDAVQAGLVDRLTTWEDLTDELRGGHDHLRTVSSPDYWLVERESLDLGGPTVAVVHAQGFITSSGEDRYDPTMGLAMGTDRVIADLEEAREDRDVKAILLRLDTPGGATLGGHRLAGAIARARDEKPVIVSVADVAASAGYMMAAPANRIVCPGSGVTGSIGSIIGKFNLRGFYEKLGVTFDAVPFAPNAFLFSAAHDWTQEQRAAIEASHWAMYDAWIAEIARSRNLDPAEVHDVARGQVWTGRQALERRLVDELGGFAEAVNAVRRLADLDAEDGVSFLHYPRQESVTEILMSGDFGRFAVNDLLRAGWQSLRGVSEGPRDLAWEPRRVQ